MGTGHKAKENITAIKTTSERGKVQDKALLDLECWSFSQEQQYYEGLEMMFKSGKQCRNVTSFFRCMYECQNDTEQQLFYFLSLPFATRKIFLKLATQWRECKVQTDDSGELDEYICIAYFYLKRCGELGTFTVK